MNISTEEFVKYCKEVFGIVVVVQDSDDPDTFEKIFGELPEKFRLSD